MEVTDNSVFNYTSLLRRIFQILEHRYQRKNINDLKVEAKTFGIDPSYSAETFLCGIYLLEDTSMAVDNYKEYGFDGPTKYENYGERYLRLYGLLNAVYMQYVCCREFYKIYKVPDYNLYVEASKELRILKARNSAASHSVNFNENGIRDFYKISQTTLKGHGEELHIIGENDKDFKFNIKEELQIFNDFIHTELHKIASHILTKMFNMNSNDYKELNEQLYLLKAKVGGAMIVPGPGDNSYIIIEQEQDPLDTEDFLELVKNSASGSKGTD